MSAPAPRSENTPVIVPLPTVVSGVETPVLELSGTGAEGAWEFLPHPVATVPLVGAACQDLDASALPSEGWEGVSVPGELVMQGFDIENNTEYYYRRRVNVPDDFSGRRVLVRFDGVYSDARVWVDGSFVRSHDGGFTSWDCDITELVSPGEDFELIVGVADLEGNAPGTYNQDDRILGNPSWASYYAHHNVGGILRDVSLLALSATHVERLHVDTALLDGYTRAEVRVRARLAGDTRGVMVRLALTDPAGEPASVLEAAPAPDGMLEATIGVCEPALWDAEHPNLYGLEVSVEKDGEVEEVVRQRVGLREIRYGGAGNTAPNRLYVNGSEVKLRGTCRHDVSDRRGRSTTRDEDRAEIEAYRKANINHVRTSHYPPSRHLLEACDELGMYVEEEVSVCFQGTGGKSIHAEPDSFFSPFAEMIERDRNHPCVIMWSLGNESAFDRTPAFRREFDYAKAVDPSRPVIFSYPYTVESMPLPYDVISRHYESVDGFLGDSNLPVLHDEFAHVPCYDIEELKRDPNVRSFWGHGLRRAWENVFRTPGALGCDLWSGIDDVFPLPAGVDGRWQRHSRGTWPGYGEWGCVMDCHRREKPEAFLVRKAFSPVRVDERSFHVLGDLLIVPVGNWFDHTSLSELELSVSVDGSRLPGVEAPDIEPHAEGLLTIKGSWRDVREVMLSWSLRGSEVDSQTLRLAEKDELPQARKTLRAPELLATDAEFRVSCANGATYRFSRRTGLITAVEMDGRAVITGGPWLHLTGVELFRPWTPTRTPWAAVEDDHVTVVLQGGYGTRVPLQFVCRIFGDGRMDVDYHTRETNLRAESMSELGIAFDLADDVMRVSWERDAPYARYPEGHIARATGTADRVCAEALEAGYGALPTWPWEHDMFDAYLSEPDDGRWRVATSDFKAMREHIRRYTVGFEEGRAHVSALSDGRAAARVELSGVHPRLVINQQWWYPQLAWGNNCGRPVQLVEGTGRGEATIRVDREN